MRLEFGTIEARQALEELGMAIEVKARICVSPGGFSIEETTAKEIEENKHTRNATLDEFGLVVSSM